MSGFFFAERLAEQRIQEELHQAKLRRLAREARRDQPGWVSRQRRRLLCQMGKFLMASGTRLLEASLPQPLHSRSTGLG
jgi:hypothetical protein